MMTFFEIRIHRKLHRISATHTLLRLITKVMMLGLAVILTTVSCVSPSTMCRKFINLNMCRTRRCRRFTFKFTEKSDGRTDVGWSHAMGKCTEDITFHTCSNFGCVRWRILDINLLDMFLVTRKLLTSMCRISLIIDR